IKLAVSLPQIWGWWVASAVNLSVASVQLSVERCSHLPGVASSTPGLCTICPHEPRDSEVDPGTRLHRFQQTIGRLVMCFRFKPSFKCLVHPDELTAL
ncbi:hypothetical protein BJ322DRAFT_1058821, partial [Thelephora terrestris]